MEDFLNTQAIIFLAASAGVLVVGMGYRLLRARIEQRHDRKFISQIESCHWIDAWKEPEYTRRLADHLFAQGIAPVKHQLELGRVGTRVDVFAVHRGEEWIITVKRGLNNQERLRLRGEVEEIVHEWKPVHGRRLHIVVALGGVTENLADFFAQIETLLRHLGDRAGGLARDRRQHARYQMHLALIPMVSEERSADPAQSET